jgi:hypothetical protein
MVVQGTMAEQHKTAKHACRSCCGCAGELDKQAWAEWDEGTSIEEQLMADLQQRGASASCKTQFVMALLVELVAGGHRTLVFSQSRVMLDILEVGGWGAACVQGG